MKKPANIKTKKDEGWADQSTKNNWIGNKSVLVEHFSRSDREEIGLSNHQVATDNCQQICCLKCRTRSRINVKRNFFNFSKVWSTQQREKNKDENFKMPHAFVVLGTSDNQKRDLFQTYTQIEHLVFLAS